MAAKLIGRRSKQSRRANEVWALQTQVSQLQLQVSNRERSIGSIVEEVKCTASTYGDKEWSDRKAQLMEDLWSHDYEEPMTRLHEEMPELAAFYYSLILGPHRLKNLEAVGQEKARDKYDHALTMQVEGMLTTVLRCRNFKSPAFIPEVLGALFHTNNVPRSLENTIAAVNKGTAYSELHAQNTLSLMMKLRPAWCGGLL